MRPRLKVQDLSKSFGGTTVLHSISLEAFGGRVLGIVGENGSGKSTALNVITGVLPRDGGQVYLDDEPFAPRSRAASDAAGIAFVQQELNIFENLTVAENLFLTHSPRRFSRQPLIAQRERRAKVCALLERVGLLVSPGTAAGALSPGERQLLEIARGLSREARILILDEPTTSLTERESARLFEIIRRLKAQNIAILYVSHNLDDVLAMSDDVMVLRDGRVASYSARRGLTPDALVRLMVGRPIKTLFPPRSPSAERAPLLLEVRALSAPRILNNIHLRVGRGEMVGLAGLMGSGRTELARAIFGLDPHRSGTVCVDGQELPSADVKSRIKAGVAFLTEDRRHEGLMLEATVAENFALAALPLFAARPGGRVRRGELLKAVGFLAQRLTLKSGDLTKTPIRTLSGGNQQKVLLGRWLLRKPKLFILDEPTRGVDISSKEEIYRLLSACAGEGMGILVISSEIEELIGLCDRIYVMARGSFAAEFERPRFDRAKLLSAAFGQGHAA
jgi:ABC-type sugar transport system ATPase subunit